jgi:hypothetical protein
MLNILIKKINNNIIFIIIIIIIKIINYDTNHNKNIIKYYTILYKIFI